MKTRILAVMAVVCALALGGAPASFASDECFFCSENGGEVDTCETPSTLSQWEAAFHYCQERCVMGIYCYCRMSTPCGYIWGLNAPSPEAHSERACDEGVRELFPFVV